MIIISRIPVLVLALTLLLSACAFVPHQKSGSGNREPHNPDMAAVLSNISPVETELVYPKIELSSEMLYTFMLADIAAQRGQTELAAQAYLALARKTRDARVARRAAQLAYESRQMEQARDALKLWHELEPRATMPRQMLATVLIGGGELSEAKPYLVDLLGVDGKNAGRSFVQLYPLLARHSDKVAVYKLLQELAEPYPGIAETHWVLAQAAQAAALHDEALVEVRQARKLKPDLSGAVLLEAQLLHTRTPADALAVLAQFLLVYEDASEVRMMYARTLLDQKQYTESRLQFQQLLTKQPDNTELAFAIALLSIQMGELERAETELKQTLKVGRKDSSTVHYYLGQLNEAKKNDGLALQEYEQVKEGEYAFPSRLRIAYLLVKQGKTREAREVLHKTVAKNSQQSTQLILSEGQILRDAKQYDAAYKTLVKGLEKLPEQPELLYEAALTADKLGKLATLEELLRKLIKVAPDHAHAYNALGYALLERKVRLQEAMQLIEKAHQLAPEDAAILDSVGWGHYLTGNMSKSIEYMRRAYAALPDPEIAAHLGEVLWQQNARDEAKSIWQENLKNNPDNAVLKTVIKKFIP